MAYHEQTPRVVELGQRVPAFQFPLDSWNGYGYHLSVNPGLYSTLSLSTGILPDLRFFTIMQNSDENFLKGKKDTQWPIRLEVDKRHLFELGLIQRIGFPSAVFGASDLDARHIFKSEALQKVVALRLQFSVPEGEYLAVPSTEAFAEGELIFDLSTKLGDADKRQWLMASKPKDEAYMQAIFITFTTVEQSGKLPRNPRFPGYDPNKVLDAWIQEESGSDPEKAKALRQQVMETPVLLDFFLNPVGNTLTYSGPDFSYKGNIFEREGQELDPKSVKTVNIREIDGKLIRFVELDGKVYVWNSENKLEGYEDTIPPMKRRRGFRF